MTDLIKLRTALSTLSNSTVSITLHETRIGIKFSRMASVVGTDEKIEVPLYNSARYEDLDNITVSEYAAQMSEKLDAAVFNQETGSNTSTCCDRALHSRGWHHDTRCPNYVVCY